MTAAIALDDERRLDALARTALLDTDVEEAFDRLTRVASRLLDAPVALVCLVDAHRQFVKSSHGLPEPWASQRETPLSHSFCQHAVTSGRPLVIDDARQHPLVCDNLAVRDLSVVAYAGIPLFTPDGFAIGSLCVIDSVPRPWSAADVALLHDLARSVTTEIELRATVHEWERLLHEREIDRNRLQRLFARLPEAIVAVDRELRTTFANPAAARLLGVDPRATPEPLPDPWPGLPLREFASRLFHDGSAESQATVTTDDGCTYLVCGLPAAEAEDALLLFEDLTARERRERAEREFVTNAAHELQTPLTAIGGAIEVLQGGAKDVPADRDEFLADIERQSHRLRRLVRALLLLAQVQALGTPPAATRVRLRPLLDQVAAELGPQDGVLVVVGCAPQLTTTTNRELLEQVLAAVSANAARYATSGTIELAGHRVDGCVVLEVRDEGPGVASNQHERVFDRFYRGGARGGDGFGLGLAIARGAADALGATVELVPRHGGGAIARVMIPDAAEGAA